MDLTFCPPSLANAMHTYFYPKFNSTEIRVYDRLRSIFSEHESKLSNLELRDFFPNISRVHDRFCCLRS